MTKRKKKTKQKIPRITQFFFINDTQMLEQSYPFCNRAISV